MASFVREAPKIIRFHFRFRNAKKRRTRSGNVGFKDLGTLEVSRNRRIENETLRDKEERVVFSQIFRDFCSSLFFSKLPRDERRQKENAATSRYIYIYIYMYNIFWLAIHGYSVSSYERRKPLEAFYLLISLITIK